MKIAIRSALVLLLLQVAPISAAAQGLSKVSVVLNFAADGGAAGFYHALERGYFREFGLEVTIEPSKGSADAITRTASQASDIGIGDISTLVEFTSRRPEIAPKTVFILHNRSPQAVIALKSSGVVKLTDLHGRILGQGPADAPSRMFRAVANIAGLDISRIEIRQFSPQLRDTMLVTKQVDAVTGFDSTVLFNLKANGVAIEDATVIYYADNGLDVYGNAFLANPAFLQARPDAVKAFVRAAARGWRDAIADPEAAMISLGKHNTLAKLDIEAERLAWLGSHQIVTPTTRTDGIGAYDRDRLAQNIAQVGKAVRLDAHPGAGRDLRRPLPPAARGAHPAQVSLVTAMSLQSIPAETTLIIRGGRAILPLADWHEPDTLDIAIAGSEIAGIAPRFAAVADAPIEELDARGHLVLPGFINAHYHSHDVLAKGTLEEVPLETWRLYALPPQYPPRSVEEVRARTLLGALECLRSGMTTIQDMLTLYPFETRHFDAVMQAYKEIGIRVVFSLQYADRKGLETIPYWKDIFPKDLHPLLSTAAEPERQLDLLGHFESACLAAPPRPRVHWALGPSSPERCSSPLMARTMELARRYDVPVYSHIYESRGMALQARLTLPEHGGSLIKRLAAEGALDPLLNLAHSVWLARAEIDLLAATGTGVVLNPQGNLKMKCGIPPIRALQDAGVRIGLGCDNCSCSDAQNMFMAMKLFALLAAASDPLPGPPQAAAALRAATESGAEGARLGHAIGRIAPGYKADLTLIDMNDPAWSPLNSAVRQLVHVEAGRGVRHVIVDGVIVVRDRRLTTIDEDEIYDAVEAVMPGFRRDFAAISDRVKRLQPWLDAAHQRMVSTELEFDRIYIPF